MLLNSIVEIQIQGEQTERFLNMCIHHNIKVFDLRKTSQECCLHIYATDFFLIKDMVKKSGMRVKILQYFINNADYLYGVKEKKEYLPELRNLLIMHSEAARIHKEELKKQTTIDITQQQQVDLLKEIAILKEKVRKLEKKPRVNIENVYGTGTGDISEMKINQNNQS